MTHSTQEQLRDIERRLVEVVRDFERATSQLEREAAATPDFPGVKRMAGAPSAMVVSLKTLCSRSSGPAPSRASAPGPRYPRSDWTPQRVDAPGQARQLVGIVRHVVERPATSARAIEQILATGSFQPEVRGNGLGRTYFDREIVERFEAPLEAALGLARAVMAARLAGTTDKPTTPQPTRDEIRHRLKFG